MNASKQFRSYFTNWKGWVYGSGFLNILGGQPIKPGYKDYAIALGDHIALLKKGRTVCIFPEGRRTLDGHYAPARGGLGYMVYVSRATVVPIAIDTFYNLSLKEFFLRRRRVKIKIGKPMPADDIIERELRNPDAYDFRQAAQKALNASERMVL